MKSYWLLSGAAGAQQEEEEEAEPIDKRNATANAQVTGSPWQAASRSSNIQSNGI